MADLVNENIPQNSESPTLGAQRIRETRAGFNDLVGAEHDISDDAQTGGFHGPNVTGKADTSITDPPTGYGRFGWKVISGVTELFYRDDAGNEVQVTTAGQLNATPPGEITQYAGSTAPTGWLLCQGQAVSRTTYSALFDVIGTTFGIGDGSTTFNLPDMKGRVPIGVGTGDASDATDHTLGEKEGAETHTLLTTEMPAHTHEQRLRAGIQLTGNAGSFAGKTPDATNESNKSKESTVSTGGGGDHNNLQPSLSLNYKIKT